MENCRKKRAHAIFRTVRRTVARADGFTYIELLVSFSLTVFILGTVVALAGEMVHNSAKSSDERDLQREASALQFMLLNELKRGYDFHLRDSDLLFRVSAAEVIRLNEQQRQLGRRVKRGNGTYKGYVLLSRYVEQAVFTPDSDGQGVAIQIQLQKGEAKLSVQTYVRSRIERKEEVSQTELRHRSEKLSQTGDKGRAKVKSHVGESRQGDRRRTGDVS
ncbi:hypothetical protein [Numidum massiliense]|uniref:hypothetical protein n=1 Tax=Numidum massiliense TaxID=1522315 RepID=UPI0011C8639B|nr:hypothetical protein [Numidum massiliense]